MVLLDWNKVLKVSPQELTEQDKEEFYEKIAWCELDVEISGDHLRTLFRLSQEVLKFKGDQVDYLVSELDSLAARQGEEEVKKLQNEEADVIRKSLRPSQDSNVEELVKLELQNEQLLAELQAREKDLLEEKKEVEKFTGQIMILEQEKNELRRELSALQREVHAKQVSTVRSSSPDQTVEKLNELTDSVRQKNKHITQLLNDIEVLEKENKILKEKLSSVRSELEDATRQMTKLAGDSSSLHHSVHEQQEQIEQLEEQNVALRRQVAELVEEKRRRDDQLDQLGLALDSRLVQWEEIMKKKDEELQEAQQKLLHASAYQPNLQLDVQTNQLALLTQAVEKREEQIEELQKRLIQATEDLNKSSEILEEYKEKLKEKTVKEDNKKPSQVKILEEQLKETEAKVSLLAMKVKDAEEDAQSKAEEMSNMIIQLRDYESGEFGLTQAMDQIKELRKQKAVRDKHIEQLVQAGNQLQEEANQLEEENLALREKLGLDVDEVIRVNGIVARHKQDKDKIVELSELVENAEDSQIQLKLENRELNKIIEELQTRLKNIGTETKIELILPSIPDKSDVSKNLEEVNSRLKEMIDENESLRKGMHEILDSVRHHDGSSTIRIESVCLERLLEALDSRHVSGWYHPAMRLQAQLNSLYGVNATLRDQLHIARENEAEILTDLQKANLQIEHLEQQLTAIKVHPEAAGLAEEEFHETELRDEESVAPKGTVVAIEFISKLKSHRKIMAAQNEKSEVNEPAEVNQDIIKLMEKVSAMEDLMQEANEKYDSDRESWVTVRAGLEEELESVQANQSALQKQVSEFKEQLEVIEGGPDEMQKKLAENGLRLGNFAAENSILNRKVAMVLDMEGRLRSKCDALTEELASLETSSKESIGQLTRDKDFLLSELKNVQSTLQESVPIADFELVKQEMNQMTVKHRGIVQRTAALEMNSNKLLDRLQEQISYWQDKCELLQIELINEREKKILASIKEPSEEVLEIAKKLAESQSHEETEKLKFEHTQRMYILMKEQVAEIEARCKELEANNATMIQHNLNAQLIEAELRSQLVNNVSRDDYSVVKSNLLTVEKQLVEIKIEKSKLLEELEISQQRVRAIESIRKEHDFQHDALQRQVLELSAVSDDKATIGRLTRELSMVYQHEIASTDTINEQQSRVQHLESVNSRLLNKIRDLEDQNENLHFSFVNKYRLLVDVIHYLHQRYLGSVPIITMNTIGDIVMHLQEQIHKLRSSVFQENNLAAEKLITTELHSEGDNTSERRSASIQRLQELNQRIETDALLYRVKHAESQTERQEKLCRDIQQELIALDMSWERKLLKWEEVQIEMCKKVVESPHQDATPSHTFASIVPCSPEPSPIPSSTDAHQEPTAPHSPIRTSKDEVKSSVDTPPTAVEVTDLQSAAVSPRSDIIVEQQMGIITSLQDQLAQANNTVSQQSVKLTNCEKVCNDLRTQLAVIGAKLEERNSHLSALKSQISEKNTQLMDKESELIELRNRPQTALASSEQHHHYHENNEILALKATVTSLQNIVNQKEETISRYQTLLKECRDEHRTTVANLQQEIDNLQQKVFDKETQMTHREKDESKEKPEHVRTIVQKYISKVHELDDELAQANDQISQLTKQLADCKKYVERMKSLAVSQEKQGIPLKKPKSKEDQVDENKERDSEEEKVDSCKESDDDNDNDYNEKYHDLEKAYSNLAVELKEKMQQIDKLNQTISDLKHNRGDSTNKDRLRTELERKKKRLEMLETRCEEYKTEVNRLRHQLISRPSRPESVASAREEQLQKRVKALEEQLAEAQQREEKERESHRSKCAEEVERWQERKRWQSANEKLRLQIKTQSSQIEVLQATQQRLRDTISRLERERNTLENKLKAMKGSAVTQTLVEDLEKEVRQLKLKNELLKKTGELTSSSASLSDVIESQQRKIEALQLAQEGESVLAEEVERLQERKSHLQKMNLKLEGENLKLKMELEKSRTHQNDSDMTAESDNSDSIVTKDPGNKKSKRSYADLERAVVVLRRVVEKLQAENKKLHNSQINGLKDKGYVEKLQVELQKVQESYMDALDKVSSLESQLRQEKDNNKAVHQQLTHKAKLLSNCKILLERAAVREKALSEQVSDLQKLVPPESLRGTYHETRR